MTRRAWFCGLLVVAMLAVPLPMRGRAVSGAPSGTRLPTEGVGTLAQMTQVSDTPAWAMYGHDAAHTSRSADTGPTAPKVAWTYRVDAGDRAIGADGTIYLAGFNAFVALHPDGTVKWSVPLGFAEAIRGTPAIGPDGTIYVKRGAVDDYLDAIRPSDGQTLWSFRLGYTTYQSPTIGPDGTIYIANTLAIDFVDGQWIYGPATLYALNPNGTVKWQRAIESADSCGMETTVALGPGGDIYLQHNCEGLVALDAQGQREWARGGGELGDPWNVPSIGPDGTIYIGSGDHTFRALNPDGSQQWQAPVVNWMYYTSSALSADGTTAYRGDNGGLLYAFSQGAVKWTFDTGIPGGTIDAAPTLSANGVLYFTQNATTGLRPEDKGYVYAVRAADGQLVWKYEIGFGGGSPVLGADGTLYVQGWDDDDHGWLYAFTQDTAPAPDLVPDLGHSGAFTAGATGTYTLTVTNHGAGATTGPITLTTTLPAGLTFIAGTGSGWNCSATGQSVTCTNAGPLVLGQGSALNLLVGIGAAAPPTVTTTACVATAGDSNPANDCDSDPAPIATPSPSPSPSPPACVVTSLADSGAGTLRAALGNTDGFANCGSIGFQAGLTGTITLASNLPTIAGAISVTGPGASLLTIDRHDQVFPAAVFPVAAGGNLTLTGLTVSGAAHGIFLISGSSTATVTNSTISGNGIGVHFSGGGTIRITNSLLRDNFEGLDFTLGGTATIANSTLVGNTYALYLDYAGTATLTNSTLSGNGTGLYIDHGSGVTATNTLLDKGSGANCQFVNAAPGSVFTNGGHNLANDATCTGIASTAQLGLDPAGLADHGGPTQTIALRAGSPALDAGDDAACALAPVDRADQRGIARPQGAHCDIGAFEARTFTLTTGTAGTGTGTVSPAGGPQPEGTVSVSATPTGGSTFAGWTVDGTPAGSTNPLAVTLNANRTVVATFATAAVPAVGLTPSSSLALGSQLVGTPGAPRAVTLINSGTGPLTISAIALAGANPGDFAYATTPASCVTTLAPNATCVFSVTFTPRATGGRSATISITDNASGSPHAIGLSGTGVASAVTFTPGSSAAFGNQAVGVPSSPQTVTLTNTGTAALSVSGLTLGGTNPGDFAFTTVPATANCGATIAVNATCAFSIRFTPVATGARSASISIADSAGGSPHTISLTGTGIAPTVGFTPSNSLGFGNQLVGTTSGAQTVTLTNTGTANLSISAVALAGANPGDFAYTTTPTNCVITLAPNATCAFNVTFSPTATGARAASISITDSAGGSPHAISLAGTGVDPNQVACVVTSLADSGAGTLRAALAGTNGFANCGAITFQAGLTGTITLASDLPTITRTVSVTGLGASLLTINRNNVGRPAFALGAGGNLTLAGLTVTGAQSGVTLVASSTATVTNSTLSGNHDAGVVFAGGSSATVLNSTVSGSQYGLYFVQGGSATVTGSTLNNNPVALYFSQGGGATLTNSTIAYNAYGLYFVSGGTATLTNSTLSANGWSLYFSGGSATLINTLLANRNTQHCTFDGPDAGITFINGGHNLADDTSCFADGSGPSGSSRVVAAGTAGLLPEGLQDHGGPTQTLALAAGSPALDAGDDATCQATTGTVPVNKVDQRGIARPQGAHCDIGAFEARTFTLTTGTAGTGTGTVSPAGGPQPEGTVSVSATPTGGSTFAGWTLDGNPAGSMFPLIVTMDTNHTVVATFAAPTSNPPPSPPPPPGNPSPEITHLNPTHAQAGDATFTLTLAGTGFVPTSVVRWDGQPRPTQYVSATRLTATIPAGDLAAAAVIDLTVVNPAPGGGTSFPEPFFITSSSAPVTAQASGSSTGAGGAAVATMGGTGPGTPGSLTATATGGAGTVTVASYGGNPAGAPPFGPGGSAVAFLDAHLSAGNTFSQVVVDHCDLGGASSLAWFDGANWQNVSNQTRTAQGCIQAVVTAGTSPRLDQLTGTYLAAGNVAPTTTYALALSAGAGGTAVASGAGPYAPGTAVTLTASPAQGQLFLGWQVDGQLASYATPYTLTMNAAHTVVATFAPRPAFGDVATSDPAYQAILNLAARGVINGCDKDAQPLPLFCPTENTLRHQMAALIARAMPGWVDETGLPTFGDNTDDTELMTRVATLQRHGVVRGYQDDVCRAQGKQPPCYGPLDTVRYGQVMLFIARAMVAHGYWTLQPDDRGIFPDQNGAAGADPATDQQTLDHRAVVTYIHYAGAPPDVLSTTAPFSIATPAGTQGWADAAPRAWFARAFWQALDSYFGH